MVEKKKSIVFYFFVFVSLIFVLLAGLASVYLSYNTSLRVSNNLVGFAGSGTGIVSLFIEGSDTISPNVSIIYPVDGQTYSFYPDELNYTVVDNNVLGSCWYSLNSGVTNTTITCGQNATGLSSALGSNTWSVYANDTFGNENSSSATFTVSIPSSSPSGSGGGGGGGGGGAILGSAIDFSISPEDLNIVLVSGEIAEEEIVVTNTGRSALNINISVSGVENIVALNADHLNINPGESESVIVSINAPESGIFAGKVVFQSGNIRKDAFLTINVRSSDALFDVSLTVPDSDRYIRPGENLRSFISLLQVGDPDEVDVTVNYIIKNFDGETLLTESETFRVFRTKSYVKEFLTADLSLGDYVAGIEVIYPGGFATSSAHFTVSDQIFLTTKEMIIMIISILFLLVILVIIISILRYKKSKRHSKR